MHSVGDCCDGCTAITIAQAAPHVLLMGSFHICCFTAKTEVPDCSEAGGDSEGKGETGRESRHRDEGAERPG